MPNLPKDRWRGLAHLAGGEMTDADLLHWQRAQYLLWMTAGEHVGGHLSAPGALMMRGEDLPAGKWSLRRAIDRVLTGADSDAAAAGNAWLSSRPMVNLVYNILARQTVIWL